MTYFRVIKVNTKMLYHCMVTNRKYNYIRHIGHYFTNYVSVIVIINIMQSENRLLMRVYPKE